MQQRLTASITLPQECDAILVDRSVSFLYTKDYEVPPNGFILPHDIVRKFNDASFIPADMKNVREPAILSCSPDHMFHIHMYSVAKQLRYEALKTAALAKLLHVLNMSLPCLTRASLDLLGDCVMVCFGPLQSPDLSSINNDSTLQQMIVAAALYHENKTWNDSQVESFNKYFDHPQYGAFCLTHNGVEKENAEMLATVFMKKQKKQKKQSKKQHRRAYNEARWAVKKQELIAKRDAEIEAQKIAGHHSVLAFRPAIAPPPDREIASTNNMDSHLTDEAQRRRARKTETRKSRAQQVDDVLAANAFVFNSIDMAGASANLERALGRSTTQMQMALPPPGVGRGGGAVLHGQELPQMSFARAFTSFASGSGAGGDGAVLHRQELPQMSLGHTSTPFASGDGARGGNEGFNEGGMKLLGYNKEQDDDAEVREGLMRMKIDDEAGN